MKLHIQNSQIEITADTPADKKELARFKAQLEAGNFQFNSLSVHNKVLEMTFFAPPKKSK